VRNLGDTIEGVEADTEKDLLKEVDKLDNAAAVVGLVDQDNSKKIDSEIDNVSQEKIASNAVETLSESTLWPSKTLHLKGDVVPVEAVARNQRSPSTTIEQDGNMLLTSLRCKYFFEQSCAHVMRDNSVVMHRNVHWCICMICICIPHNATVELIVPQ
jgi:hypothetical protein